MRPQGGPGTSGEDRAAHAGARDQEVGKGWALGRRDPEGAGGPQVVMKDVRPDDLGIQ